MCDGLRKLGCKASIDDAQLKMLNTVRKYVGRVAVKWVTYRLRA